MVWSQLAELKTPPVVTTDFIYLRLIGDRSIQEKDFGRVQIDRVLDMQKRVDNLKTVEDEHLEQNPVNDFKQWGENGMAFGWHDGDTEKKVQSAKSV